jgi:hypothetical protein
LGEWGAWAMNSVVSRAVVPTRRSLESVSAAQRTSRDRHGRAPVRLGRMTLPPGRDHTRSCSGSAAVVRPSKSPIVHEAGDQDC